MGLDFVVRIRLGGPAISNILNVVRNTLLKWTVEMEDRGITGPDLTFKAEDKAKSVEATERVVNNINIGQVSSFIQAATNTTVTASLDASTILLEKAKDLTQQLETLLPAAQLPAKVQADAEAAVVELKEASNEATPNPGRVRGTLNALQRALAPAGEKLVKIAVDAAINKMTDGS